MEIDYLKLIDKINDSTLSYLKAHLIFNNNKEEIGFHIHLPIDTDVIIKLSHEMILGEYVIATVLFKPTPIKIHNICIVSINEYNNFKKKLGI